MTKRSRTVWFGGAALLVLAGAVAAITVADGTGEVLALVLIGLGLVLATSLVFLEVGLSEDRERERDVQRRERDERRRVVAPARAARRKLGRMRGSRRRLRRGPDV